MKKILICILSLLTLCITLSSCDLVTTISGIFGGNHSHQYGEWSVQTVTTCLKDGEEVRTCECGEKEYRTVKTPGHIQGEWVVTEESTCSVYGTMKAFCKVCTRPMAEEKAPLKDHSFVAAYTYEPGCTTKGRTLYECENCDEEKVDNFVDALGHDCKKYDKYNFDATVSKNGTVSGDCSRCGKATKELEGSSELLAGAFSGKKISVLGDSISTFYGVSDGIAADTSNSTIRDSVLYYDELHAKALNVSREATWWQRTADALGAEILVNNSWSGSYIKDASTNTRSTPGAYLDRCENLHDNTGSDAGTNPDIILVYMGTNDYYKYKTTHGSADSVDYSDLSSKLGDDYIPTTVAEAYAIMLYKMSIAYPNAEIYCLNVLESSSSDTSLEGFNSMIEDVAENLGAKYVDICANSGIKKGLSYENYVPSNDGDDTPNSLHPNSAGMYFISQCVIDTIVHESKYAPDMSVLFE